MRYITNEPVHRFKEYLTMEEKSQNTIEKYIRDIFFFMVWLCSREVTKILALAYKKGLCEKNMRLQVSMRQYLPLTASSAL